MVELIVWIEDFKGFVVYVGLYRVDYIVDSGIEVVNYLLGLVCCFVEEMVIDLVEIDIY